MNCTICGEKIEETKIPCDYCSSTGKWGRMMSIQPKRKDAPVCPNCKGTGIFIHRFEVLHHYEMKHPDLVKLLSRFAMKSGGGSGPYLIG